MKMPITVSFAREIVREAKDNSKLLSMLAGELAKVVDRDALAEYLLDDEMARQLLAQRLAKAPDRTLSDLERLARGKSVPSNGAAARRAAAPRKTAAKAATAPKAAKSGGKGRRHRLTATEVESYKREILDFLSKNPDSNRKAISGAVGLPTPSIYNRLMGELKNSGQVRSQGQKSKTVYTLTTGATRAPRKATGRKKKKTTRKKAKA